MKRSRKEAALLAAATVVILLVVHAYALMYTPASRQGASGIVEVPRGASFRAVADDLVRRGLLKDSRGFSLAAALSGSYRKIRAGEYELSPSMPPVEILNILVEGRTKLYSVTIPEGFNVTEIAEALEKKGLVDKEVFLERVRDKGLLKSLGVDGTSFEGYLFPDTYRFSKGMTADEIIAVMVGRFMEVYDREFRAQAEEKGMTTREVVTLASMIEKETGRVEEMPKISAVFHNRLKRGIRLASDPTVIYGIEDFDGNLTRKHLATFTPYNTYRIYGLPPGPIANPGRAAIQAALNPADENYLYFVSRNDGTHKFSRTLKEHNRAVRKYQKRRSSRSPNG